MRSVENPAKMQKVVYKILGPDATVLYVGSSTRTMQNVQALHKHRSKTSKLPFYKYIRESGEWNSLQFIFCGLGSEQTFGLSPKFPKKIRTLSKAEYSKAYRASKPRGEHAERVQFWRDRNPEKSKAIRLRENAVRRAKRAMKNTQIQERGLVKIDDR
jgi:hypothetical protein